MTEPIQPRKVKEIFKSPLAWGSGAVGATIGAGAMYMASGGLKYQDNQLSLLRSSGNVIVIADNISVEGLQREIITLPPLKVAGP